MFDGITTKTRSRRLMRVTCKTCRNNLAGTKERLAPHYTGEVGHSVTACTRPPADMKALGRIDLDNMQSKRAHVSERNQGS